MNLVAAYFIGMLVGAVMTLAYLAYLGFQEKMREKEEEAALDKVQSKKMGLDDRMTRVREIAKEMIELSSASGGPQKNALDGKYKNSLMKRMRELDEEKNALLTSILDDGHDPKLTTIDETGTVTEMYLSQYMAEQGYKAKPKKKEEPKAKQVGKFTVISGGKPDGNTTH